MSETEKRWLTAAEIARNNTGQKIDKHFRRRRLFWLSVSCVSAGVLIFCAGAVIMGVV